MAEKESTTIVRKDDDADPNRPPQPNPVFSLFSKFVQSFNFPPPKRETAKVVETTVVETTPMTAAAVAVSSEVEESKPATVRFPDTRPAVAPLKLEAEELEQDTNPVVLWQVYAIGGFFILRWALARWKERRAKKKPSDEPSSEDPPANP